MAFKVGEYNSNFWNIMYIDPLNYYLSSNIEQMEQHTNRTTQNKS